MAATNKRGVFSLEKVLERQDSNNWVKIPEVFRYVVDSTQGTPYGYITAGFPASSTVDRIDYSNDTATAAPKGPLSSVRGYHSATGNTSYGYTFGGWSPGEKSFIDRIDYSNDTATGSPKGYLTANKYGTAAAGTADYGYITGGTPPYLTNVDRIDYSNDTANAVAKGPLAAARRYLGAAGNATHGFFVAGITGSDYFSNINKLDYSNDTATVPGAGNLSLARSHARGSGNSTYGYFGGGLSDSDDHSTVDRVEYANDTGTSPTKGSLDIDRKKFSTVSTGSAGYYAGGQGSPSAGSSISKIDFSNDTATATPKGLMSSARRCTGGTSSRDNAFASSVRSQATRTESGVTPVPNFGYAIAGQSSLSLVDRIDYANDTATAAVKGSLSQTFQAHQSTSNLTHAYVAAGYPSPSKTSVDRIEFANDTSTGTPKGPLSAGRQYYGATGNTSFGYFAGGAPSVISSVDRIDYSSDTSTASPKGPLSFAKGNSQGCGNMSFGYFAGGDGNKSSVDRIDYSSDTSTASPKGNLENSRSTMVASGTSDVGYWSGGFPYYTKTSRIDYSNDTATAVAKAPYPSAVSPYGHSNAAGTGNSTHGYAFGGNGDVSYVWRIDYANDTADAVSKGPLSLGRIRFSGGSPLENGLPSKAPGPIDKGADGYLTQSTSGNSTYPYGYIAGGNPTTTYVDRIDYGNDTATASPKGNLTQQRYNYNQSVASPSKGYVMGGYTPSVPEPNGNLSSIDRIDLSNDTATAPSVANLNASPGIYAAATTSNNDYAYLAGGGQHPGPTFSTIRRFDYSSDTSNTVDKSTLSGSKNFITGTGNLSFGYFGGYAPTTTIERLDYASDTTQAAPKGPLTLSLRLRASTGNQSYGYFSGGQNPSPAIPDGYNDSTIERIDYSNDTATASPKGPMSSARYLHAATGSGRYGYHVGGRIGTSTGST